MSEYHNTYTISNVKNESQARQIINELMKLRSVIQVDVNITQNLISIQTRENIGIAEFNSTLRSYGVEIIESNILATSHKTPNQSLHTITLNIEGMHCRSCELIMERKFRDMPGVCGVTVDATRGLARVEYEGELNIPALQAKIVGDGYSIISRAERHNKSSALVTTNNRPSFWQIIGAFVVILLIGKILSRFGLLNPNIGAFNSTSLGAIFLLGLVAASSSCVAVAGGLLLSSVNVWRERYKSSTSAGRIAPVLLFVVGRILGYGILGVLIGLIGKSLTPSPLITGIITIVAALYMLMMGLDMIHLAPSWFKRLLPSAPKALGHKVMAAENKSHIAMPALLGAGTFFLPCGFTQALQLYALTTGDPILSGTMLAVFALGTAPALIGLGLASSLFTGKLGTIFFRLAGATVVVLGLWNIQNGLTIVGYPLPSVQTWWRTKIATTKDPNVTFDGRVQIVRMSTSDEDGYTPSQFTLRQGVPVRWEIDASQAGGCIRVLQAPRLGIRNQLLKTDKTNVIEFTPREVGTFSFSCSMGMYRGQIIVIPNS